MILRPYQQQLVDKAHAALSAHKNTLAVAPTGAGKTIILAALAGKVGGNQCIVQHRDELTAQNLQKYKAVNPRRRVSLFNADVKSWNGDAVFAMAQTLTRNLSSIPKLDLLIIDEAHHVAAPSYGKIIEAVKDRNPDCKIFGVTATPSRGDGKGLRRVFDNCCAQISLHSLISMGFLVKPRTFVCTLDGTDDKLASLRKTSSGEFDLQEAAEVLDLEVHNSAVVREWQKLATQQNGEVRKTIIFASTVEHARHVAAAFRSAGICAATVTGDMPAGERAALLKDFDSPTGSTQVLVNVAVLTEGFDSQPVSCVVLLRPCSYKSTMLQMIGRGLRTVDPALYPGIVKTDCLVLDFGRSLVTHQDLESKVRLDDRPKHCPECQAEVPCGVSECPLCGHEFKGAASSGGDSGDGQETVSNVSMEEVDILNASPFRWCDIFGAGKVMLASGFEAWSAVCSPDGERWLALGKLKGERDLHRLSVGERIPALAAADDFLRMNESDDAAKKNRRWLNDAATGKQWELLQRLGYAEDRMLTFTKYSAACTLNFFWHRGLIEREVLHG